MLLIEKNDHMKVHIWQL